MTKSELLQLFQDFNDENIALMTKKNADYAHDDSDSTANFKRHAKELGLTPFQVWRVYAGKHFDAITKYCRDGAVDSEGIYGRIQDMSVYLVLLLALIRECDPNCGAKDSVGYEPTTSTQWVTDPGKMHLTAPVPLR